MMFCMKNNFFLLAFILVSVVSTAQDTAKAIRITDDLEIIQLSKKCLPARVMGNQGPVWTLFR